MDKNVKMKKTQVEKNTCVYCVKQMTKAWNLI